MALDPAEIKVLRMRTEKMRQESCDFRPYNDMALMGELDCMVELLILDEMLNDQGGK